MKRSGAPALERVLEANYFVFILNRLRMESAKMYVKNSMSFVVVGMNMLSSMIKSINF